MPKVCTTVNLFDENRRRVTLLAGDEVPEWALARVTNPKVLLAEESPEKTPETPEPPITSATAPTTPVGAETTDYSKLNKDVLVALCKERDLDTKGNKPELIARLEEADKAGSTADENADVDVWELDVDELKALAEKRGVDIGEVSTQVELATLLQAKE